MFVRKVKLSMTPPPPKKKKKKEKKKEKGSLDTLPLEKDTKKVFKRHKTQPNVFFLALFSHGLHPQTHNLDECVHYNTNTTQLFRTSNFTGPGYQAALLFSGLGCIVLLFHFYFFLNQYIREDLAITANCYTTTKTDKS